MKSKKSAIEATLLEFEQMTGESVIQLRSLTDLETFRRKIAQALVKYHEAKKQIALAELKANLERCNRLLKTCKEHMGEDNFAALMQMREL